MLNADIKKSVKVVLGVCLVCSFFVSTAAVMLQSVQKHNRRIDRITHILDVADLLGRSIDVERIYRTRVEPVMIDLSTGTKVGHDRFDDVLNLENFDIDTLAADPDYGVDIPPEFDRARIKRRPRYMVVYLVKKDRHLDKLILPVYGKGLWSTLHGFLALNSDLVSIAGISFYQHNETPGLGGEVDDPQWKDSWKGKQAFSANGDILIEVVRGEVDTQSSNASHQIEGLSGATLTSRGVNNLIRYWLGEHGYGPFLDGLRQGALADLAAFDKAE
ncbi:MAG: Na(+)-translocating NADH-quinone reductase subunit C [Gammaproteobacteria bacterium]